MTRRLQLLAALFAALLLTGSAHAAQAPAPPPAAVVGIISGGVDGTYIRVAADLATVLDDPRLRVLPMVGKGSLQNIDDMLHLRGVDIGIVQSDVLAYIRRRGVLPEAEHAVSYIAKLYDEEVHILARAGIDRVEELAGKTVNVDGRGSGTALTASIVFEGLGIAVNTANDDQGTALDKLRKGEIDALVYVAGKPARLFSGIPAGSGLHLLALPLTPALLATYVPSRFERADYPGLIEGDASVDTVAVGAVMAVFTWPPGSDRYRMVSRFVDAFFTAFPRFQQAPRHPKWREVHLEAQVPGWSQFGPAAEWLQRRAAPEGLAKP